MLTQRSRKRVLLLVNAALAAGLVAVAAAAFTPPQDIRAEKRPQRGRTAQASDGEPRVGPLESYAAVWQRSLRNPLFDAPPPKEVVKPPPAPPNVRLIFTAVEGSGGTATFQTPAGDLRTVSVGESIDGAVLLEVTQSSAILRVAGEKVTLTRDKGGS